MKESIILNPQYLHIESFVKSIPDIFSKEGVTIYKSRNEIKVFEFNGLQINVKQYRKPSFLNRIIYTLIRPSKGLRAFNYAKILTDKGFSTPEPIAYIVYKQHNIIAESYFISIQSQLSRTMYEFGTSEMKGKEDVVKALGLFTARMHDAGIYHRDYSPGNILFDKVDGEVQFCLVDINRMDFGAVSIKKGCKNFQRLWGKDDFFTLLATEYAKCRGIDIAQCVAQTLQYKRAFWEKYAKRHPASE